MSDSLRRVASTFDPTSAVETLSALDQLAERLARAIEARNRRD